MIVLGTILNDSGEEQFMNKYSMSLPKDVFSDKRNAFIYGLIYDMHSCGRTSFTPHDVLEYAIEKGVKYGNVVNFCLYMCELSERFYAPFGILEHIRRLVKMYISDKKRNGAA